MAPSVRCKSVLKMAKVCCDLVSALFSCVGRLPVRQTRNVSGRWWENCFDFDFLLVYLAVPWSSCRCLYRARIHWITPKPYQQYKKESGHQYLFCFSFITVWSTCCVSWMSRQSVKGVYSKYPTGYLRLWRHVRHLLPESSLLLP